MSLLTDVEQCITLLNERHRLLIEALLNISWTDRRSEVTTAYKRFVEELLVAHVYHSKFVIDKLILKFKPGIESRNFRKIYKWKMNSWHIN